MHRTLRSLYVCYLSLDDPLAHSQVIAYLAGLAERGHTVHLLTFEPSIDWDRQQELRTSLRDRGIVWHALRYHKRPSLPATLYDALVGAALATWLVRRHRLDVVHARSHVPAAMALLVRRVTGARLIFDIRGLWAEEYVDSGRWRRGGIAYRITDGIQRLAIGRATGIVTLTARARDYLFGSRPPKRSFVIPCCADLEGRLAPREGGSERIRESLGLGDRPVLVYVGKLTRPYMDREMVEFFAAAQAVDPRLAFLVITQAPPDSIAAELARANIDKNDVRITRSEPADMGDYLAVADFAICFCRPALSLIAASPTKIGEYLAAGLPVVSGPGVGDIDRMLIEREVGVVVDGFSARAYGLAAERIRDLASDPTTEKRCRTVAEEQFSLIGVGIQRYDELYREVAGTLEENGR